MDDRLGIMHLVLNLHTGGLERLVVGMVKYTDRKKYRPVVCTLQSAGNEGLERDLERYGVMRIGLCKKEIAIDCATIFRLSRLLKREQILIIHTHNWLPLFYGIIASIMAGTPIRIHTKHGADISTSNFMVSFIRKIVASRVDKCIAVSEDVKREVSRGYEIKNKRLSVINNGIDAQKYILPEYFDVASKKVELGLIKTDYAICIVARLSLEKDHTTLFKAISILSDKGGCPNIKLLVIGNGPCGDSLRAATRALGISDRVIFLGERMDIPEILGAIDLFALSSLTEGMSLTLLEAMAASKPVIATNVGGNPEVVIDGVTGLLVPPNNPRKMAKAVMKIMQNPDLAKRMGQAGRKRVEEKFSLDRMVHEYEVIYEECLSKTIDHRPKARDFCS